MYCENCGKKVNDDTKYCKECGAKVENGKNVVADITNDFKNKRYSIILNKLKNIGNEAGDKNLINKIRGDANFITGNYNDAKEAYLKIKNEKREWDANFNLALIHLNGNEFGEAIKYMEAILKQDIDFKKSMIYSERYSNKKVFFIDIYLYLGVLYKSLDKIENSIKYFKNVTESDAGNELANANLGDIYFKQDNYDEAMKYYQKAINNSRDYFRKSYLYNDIGLCFFRKGLIEEAINMFKKAIILNSDNQDAIHNLGIIYVRSGLQDKVKDDYKEFLKYERGVDIVFNLSRSIMNVAKKEMLGEINIDFIGESDKMKKVKEIIIKTASTDTTVLIQGENGTGKELVARAIHQLSKRDEKPFIVVNCGALPETLLESELFGYEKGAFTGAVNAKPGRFELADKGTVFLDEIGDITQGMQVKLLRFVQQKEFERVGGTETKKVDVRIIAATNKDIKKLVDEGQFREDLYYRLYVLPVFMPPLRERGKDVIILAQHFLKKFNEKYGKNFQSFLDDALEAFYKYSWPGNVRQLENVVERIMTLYDDEEVKLEYLPEEILQYKPNKAGANDTEKGKIIEVLKSVNYSKTKAAKFLGISRVALWKKMTKLGIK